MRALDAQCRAALDAWQWERLDSLSALLASAARESSDERAEARAAYYQSVYRPGEAPQVYDRRQARLLQAAAMAERCGNDTLLSSIYNTMGVYELGRFRRYHTSQYYFNKAADVARKARDTRGEIAASLNLSEVCRILRDTLGLSTDLRLHRLAKNDGIRAAVFASALHLAQYYNKNAMDSAKMNIYLRDMRQFPDLAWAANAVEAEYYLNTGDLHRALALVQKANPDKEGFSANIYVFILSRMGRHAEANEWIDQLLASPEADRDLLDHGALLAQKAANLNALGDAAGAYAAQLRATQWRDSVAASMKSDQINRFKVEYQVGEKNHQIDMQRARLKRVELMAVCVALFLLLVIAGILFYMRRRRAFYRAIVSQRLEAMKAEPPEPAPKEKTPMKSAKIDTSDRHAELYERIRREVEERRAYSDVSVTREVLAERLGTNRTYLTEAIKEATGMSYTQYMNAHRINEAVRVLSDPADATTLKELAARLGFLSLGTFYTAFKGTTGVSPAAFRRTARELKSGATD